MYGESVSDIVERLFLAFSNNFVLFFSATESADSNPPSEPEDDGSGKAGFASGKCHKCFVLF